MSSETRETTQQAITEQSRLTLRISVCLEAGELKKIITAHTSSNTLMIPWLFAARTVLVPRRQQTELTNCMFSSSASLACTQIPLACFNGQSIREKETKRERETVLSDQYR